MFESLIEIFKPVLLIIHLKIQGVDVAVAAKRVIWIKARPDFDVLFQLLNNPRVDEHRRFWIAYPEAKEDACDIREELGQKGMEVKIAFPMSTRQALVLQSDLLTTDRTFPERLSPRDSAMPPGGIQMES